MNECENYSPWPSEVYDAIRWWERELTGEQRHYFMGDDLWSGPVKARHERLLGFYRRRNEAQAMRQ